MFKYSSQKTLTHFSAHYPSYTVQTFMSLQAFQLLYPHLYHISKQIASLKTYKFGE